MRAALVAAAILTAVASAGCAGDRTGPDSDYCQAVQDHQTALSDIAASTEPGVVFEALDHYRDLADQANALRAWTAFLNEPLSQAETREASLPCVFTPMGFPPHDALAHGMIRAARNLVNRSRNASSVAW